MTEQRPSIDSDHDDLIAQLANLDEASELGEIGATADSTVRELKVELETLLSDVQQPAPVDEFENESGCRRAMEMVRQIGQDPSFTGGQPADRIVAEAEDLGSFREYQLLSKLGQGGMGTVYKALHTKLDKIVALKVLPTDKLQDEHAVARFEREMKAVGRLEHPNIVRATDAGEVDGKHFLVMEHVEGLDLSAIVRSTGPLRVADACEIIRQAAIGLQHANEHGLVHRDIKPSNMMLAVSDQPSAVSQSAIVKILDMGLALLEEHRLAEQRDLTTTGQMMGTLDYMAPEQGEDSHEVDIRADIYSLGATLFKLLCGDAPFAGDKHKTPMQVMMAIASQPAPSIAERRDDVPAELADIVDRMLRKNPDDRFATPRQVAAALEPFAGGCDLAGLLERAERESEVESDDASLARTGEFLSSPSTETETDTKEPVRAASDHTHGLEKTQLAKALPGTAAWYKRPAFVAAVAFGLVGFVAVAVVIRIMTDKGELIIRSEDVNVQVTVQRHNGELVKDIELTKGQGQTTLRSGKYEIIIAGANADQFKITPSIVTLSRTGREIVTIERKVMEAVATSHPTNSNDDPDRRVAKWVLSVGGSLKIQTDAVINIHTRDELPNRRFNILYIYLQDVLAAGTAARILRDANGVNDDGLANLAGLKHAVIGINLGNCPDVTDKGLSYLSGYRCRPRQLDLSATSVTDDGLKTLASWELESLTLSKCRISDQGLEHLAGCHELINLFLNSTSVSDAGLSNLYGLENLRLLWINDTKVTADGLAALRLALPQCYIKSDFTDEEIETATTKTDADHSAAKWVLSAGGTVGIRYRDAAEWRRKVPIGDRHEFPAGFNPLIRTGIPDELPAAGFNLQQVWLARNPAVTDTDLLNLANLTISELYLSETSVTDAGLEHLSTLSGLLALDLRETHVTDAGLSHLMAMKRLKILILIGTNVTDVGLKNLRALGNLQKLYLPGTRVTAYGVAKLQLALPDCKIASDFTDEQVADAAKQLQEGSEN